MKNLSILHRPPFYIIIAFLLIGLQTHAQISGSSSPLSVSASTATIVDPAIIVGGSSNFTNATVQITENYYSGDLLSYNAGLASSFGITGSYNNASGILKFTGTTSPANWQALLRTVTYQNTSAACGPAIRTIIFSQGSYLYSSLNGHFYEYISSGLNWKNAKAAAAARTYNGMQGYLATSTSPGENSFILKSTTTSVLLGGSYDYQEINTATGTTTYANQSSANGHLYWITGPEKGTPVSSGIGTPVSENGQYMNWAWGEPNNYNAEYYIQMYSGSGVWNDLGIGSVLPYFVEYGGMAGDIPQNNSFSRQLNLLATVGGEINGGNVTICAGSGSIVLTSSATGPGVSIVRWESSLDNFLTAGVAINNPTASLTVNNLTQTTYFRSVASGNSCGAAYSASTKITTTGTLIAGGISGSTSLCNGTATSLTLAGYTGIITKWQSSTDNITWSDISNTTTTHNTGALTSGNYFFRAEIKNATCEGYTLTSPLMVTVFDNAATVPGAITGPDFVCNTANQGLLTLSGYHGVVNRWEYSIDDGNNWYSLGNASPTYEFFNLDKTRKFRAVVQNGPCNSIAYSPLFTVTYYPAGITSIWTGTASSDFGDAANWSCAAIPVNGSSILIRADAANMPVLNQDFSFRNIQFQSNTNLDINGYNLTLTGTVTGAATGIFKGSSSSKLTVEGSADAGTLYLDQSYPGQSNVLHTLEMKREQGPVPTPPSSSACVPDASWGFDGTGIARVSLESIDNSTDVQNGYTDYTSLYTLLDPSTTHTLSVTTASNYYDDQGIWAWIDWNDNGVFGDDANEVITDNGGGWEGTYDFSFTTPPIGGSVTGGPKRMRIYIDNYWYLQWYGFDACNGGSGEYEDYTIYLSPTQMANGSITIGNNLVVTNLAMFTSGVLNTGGNSLIINDGATVTGASSVSYVNGTVRKVGNTAFTFPVGNSDFFAPISISAPASPTDHFTASYFHTDPLPVYNNSTYANGLVSISNNEHWILDRTSGSSNVMVTLSWDAARSASIANMGRLRVARWNGSQWTDAGNAGLSTGSTTAGTVTSLLVNNFSPFTIGTSSFTLPVNLVSFTVMRLNKAAKLTWQTASETNSNRFDVEHSIDGNSWIKIGEVKSAGTSSSAIDYAFNDDSPAAGNNYYRLKQVDNDSKFVYSQVRLLYFGLSTLATVYPNPFASNITVDAGNKIIGNIYVVDLSGKTVYKSRITNTKATVNLDHLPAGQYTIIHNNTYFKVIKMGR